MGSGKHGHPKNKFSNAKAVLICQGIAKKFKDAGIKVTGRRNAFASLLCPRSDPWQSGTHACFAVAFRSNSHTAPNWRLPPIEGLHCNEICKNPKCALQSNCQRYIKAVSKITQRIQRLCTGYYCGYTFKSQPVGKKALKGVAESLNYLTSGLSDKSQGKKWHRITHRILTDLHHRSIRRTAAEEWNLALHCDHKDIFAGEFVRTYISAPFNGNILLRRLELFEKNESSMQTLKNLTVRTGKENFHFFDDESQRGFFSMSVNQCHTAISKSMAYKASVISPI